MAQEWVYGINPVKEALRSGRPVYAVYIYGGIGESKRHSIVSLCAKRSVQVNLVDKSFFKAFPKAHQGVAARVSELPEYTLEDLPRISQKRGSLPFYIIVDGVEDPHNLGSIIRTSEVAGVHAVVVQKRRSAGGPTVAKASAGAIEHIPLVRVPNIKHAIGFLKTESVVVIGATSDAKDDLWEVDLRVPLAIVLGSEGKGIRQTVKRQCDRLIRIPMYGKVNSLNVSVAAGILIYEVLRQRTEGGHSLS